MPGKIVLFGATGYTGGLAAEEMARGRVTAVLAGRSRDRLEALAARLDGGLTVATADVADPASVAALVGAGDVLLTTVGPFARFGHAAARAAVDRGAHYVDSTGEPGFIRAVYEEYGPKVEDAGVTLLTAFGYDNVPGHVAAAMALEEAGDAAVHVDVGYFNAGGRPSSGTVASLAGVVGTPSFAWRGGRLVTERAGVRSTTFDLGGRRGEALSFGGSEHFALPRSYPRLQTVGTYLGWFGPFTKAVQAAGAGQAALSRIPGAAAVVARVTERVLPTSNGSGPDAASRARSRSIFTAVARDGEGHDLASVRLEGIDAYTLTARLLVWGAVQLRDGAARAPGARGPIEAFGLDVMTRALAGAGLTRVA